MTRSCGRANGAPNFSGASECDLVQIGMLDKSFSGRPVARYDVHYARRQRDLLANLRKQQRRERREFSRLQDDRVSRGERSEEHTSELQSHLNLVCRLLLEKKKKNPTLVEIRKKNRTKQKNT